MQEAALDELHATLLDPSRAHPDSAKLRRPKRRSPARPNNPPPPTADQPTGGPTRNRSGTLDFQWSSRAKGPHSRPTGRCSRESPPGGPEIRSSLTDAFDLAPRAGSRPSRPTLTASRDGEVDGQTSRGLDRRLWGCAVSGEQGCRAARDRGAPHSSCRSTTRRCDRRSPSPRCATVSPVRRCRS